MNDIGVRGGGGVVVGCPARGLSATERDAVLRAFDEALKKQPETYDTGDGIIRYGEHLREARAAFRSAQ